MGRSERGKRVKKRERVVGRMKGGKEGRETREIEGRGRVFRVGKKLFPFIFYTEKRSSCAGCNANAKVSCWHYRKKL